MENVSWLQGYILGLGEFVPGGVNNIAGGTNLGIRLPSSQVTFTCTYTHPCGEGEVTNIDPGLFSSFSLIVYDVIPVIIFPPHRYPALAYPTKPS